MATDKPFEHKRVTLALVNHKEGSKAHDHFGARSWALKPVAEGAPGLPFTTAEDVVNVVKRLAVACLRHKAPTSALWVPGLEGDARRGPRDFESGAFFIKDALSKGTEFKAGRYGNTVIVGGKSPAKATADPEVAKLIAEFLK